MRLAPRIRRGALALAALLLAAVGAELAFRAHVARSGRSYSRSGLLSELEQTARSMNQAVPGGDAEEERAASPYVAHPYYGFEQLADHARLTEEARSLAPDRRGDEWVVAIVGGSVAAMLALDGGERLRDVLLDDPRVGARGVRLLSHGRGSFKQPQQLTLVAWLFTLGIVPDVLVNLDGFNEVALSADNRALDVHPLYPHWARWAHLSGAERGDERGTELHFRIWGLQREALELVEGVRASRLAHSALYGRSQARRMYGLRAQWSEALAAYQEFLAEGGERLGPAPPAAQDSLETVARAWAECSVSIDALCRARGVRYLHVLQPTLHDEGSKPLTSEERAAGAAHPAWVRGVREGYPLLRAHGDELRARGVEFVDASQAFATVRETLYFDACHVVPAGSELLAEAIAAALLERL